MAQASDLPDEGKSISCGIVMPISSLDGCPPEHWSEVKQIIQDAVEAISAPRFTARLVSDADDVGVIQKRIVQGVYSSDILVCDVSGRNPNVMFELGMRLAFDKPTVIIKDDKTDYAFDTSIIEHIPYPRDLRFSRITAFKKHLADKVLATYLASQSSTEHSTFLKNFGTFKVAQLSQASVPGDQVILEMLSEMQQEMTRMRRTFTSPARRWSGSPEEMEKRTLGIAKILHALDQMGLNRTSCTADIPEDVLAKTQSIVHGPSNFKSPSDFNAAIREAYSIWLNGPQ